MQLGAATFTRGEKAFEKLNRSSDDHRSIPVSGNPSQALHILIIVKTVPVKAGMMFNHLIPAQHAAKDIRRLFDDRGKWNDVDDPLQPVVHRMIQCEPQRGQRFATTCGDGQSEQPGTLPGLRPHMGQDIGSQRVDRTWGAGKAGDVVVESLTMRRCQDGRLSGHG